MRCNNHDNVFVVDARHFVLYLLHTYTRTNEVTTFFFFFFLLKSLLVTRTTHTRPHDSGLGTRGISFEFTHTILFPSLSKDSIFFVCVIYEF